MDVILITLFFLFAATFVCVITIIPMFLVPIAFVVFLINAPVACLITCGAIFGAVVVAAIVTTIAAMCSAASVYKNKELMKTYKYNIWDFAARIWVSIYSVYDKISAIGNQKKTDEGQSLNKNINQNQEDTNKDKNNEQNKNVNININEYKSKNQNLNLPKISDDKIKRKGKN